MYFIRQMDDFAISSTSKDIGKEIISKIDSHMVIKMKYLGIIERFNVVDVDQTRHYIKVNNATYITKITVDKELDDHR